MRMRNGRYETEYGFFYYKDDKFHREEGPAIEYIDGYRAWYKEGKRHRLDGPATELANGEKYWYIEGKHIDCTSQEEFERIKKEKFEQISKCKCEECKDTGEIDMGFYQRICRCKL